MTATQRPLTSSWKPARAVYRPSDLKRWRYGRALGDPGQYPYTRAIHPVLYRQQPWTIREFAGFGTAQETNRRFRLLLKEGQMGLSVAFDMPTLMGLDSDDPKAEGEVGRCGVAIDSLEDMKRLFRGIPMGRISTSMTINGPACVLLAFYIAAAQDQDVSPHRLRGTIQNDILKEYIAQREWIFPPEPSLRIVVDMIEYCTPRLPAWNTISISGYHIREAGSTAAQELAFTLADGFTYVEACLKRGLKIDDFAPRLSFFFNSHLDFFEEIAKFRAARRIWARQMKEVYRAKKARSLLMRFHTQTAGCTLTRQQPENNIVRTAYEALAAVLGGTQSLHTNSMDEQLALPSEKAVRIALRTQQILQHEIGMVKTVDPLGGSYYMETLTDQLELEAKAIFRQIKRRGGVLGGIESGFFQKEIARAAKRYQEEIDRRERIVVGVNAYENLETLDIPILKIDPALEKKQKRELARLKQSRSRRTVQQALDEIRSAAEKERNLMGPLIQAAHRSVTIGEMIRALKEVFGVYRPKFYV